MDTELAKLNLPAEREFSSGNLVSTKIKVMHIKLWYKDGRQSELNLTSPAEQNGEDIETQYLYLRLYIRKMAPLLDIVAYQGNIVVQKDNGDLYILGKYAKVDCSTLKPFKPGQYCDPKHAQ